MSHDRFLEFTNYNKNYTRWNSLADWEGPQGTRVYHINSLTFTMKYVTFKNLLSVFMLCFYCDVKWKMKTHKWKMKKWLRFLMLGFNFTVIHVWLKPKRNISNTNGTDKSYPLSPQKIHPYTLVWVFCNSRGASLG